MPRQFDHVFGQGDGLLHPATVKQVRAEPLIVVSEIMNLIRQNPRCLHISVVRAGRCLLLPGGIVVALELAVNVAGHVPHVRNARRGLAAPGRRIERMLVLLVIPEMDSRMMNRVERLDRKNLFHERLDRLAACDRYAFRFVFPDLKG